MVANFTSPIVGVEGCDDVVGPINDGVATGVDNSVGVTKGLIVGTTTEVEVSVGVGVGVSVATDVGVGETVVVISGVSVISGMIISIVELICMSTLRVEAVEGSTVTDEEVSTMTDDDVICPLTSSSVNTIINKPMHLFHCLSILHVRSFNDCSAAL